MIQLLDGPWTLELTRVGDLEAVALAAEARIAKGLAIPGEGDRVRATHIPDTLLSGPIPATVPGCVHTDLMAAGLLEDPWVGLAESAQHWIGACDWTYRTTLPPVRAAARHELVFEGLDTIADVTLDGARVLEARDQHRSWRVDVTDRLADGTRHQLEVRFQSPTRWAAERERRLGEWPRNYPDPMNQIRKQACDFGWDWGPTLIGAGIWRPVSLVSWDTARLDEVRVSATAPGGIAQLSADIRVARADSAINGPLEVEVRVASHVATVDVTGDTVRVDLSAPGAGLWWPRSHGTPALHECVITLRDAAGAVLDTWTRRVGFRDVAIVSEPDALGRSFAIHVNGERVWARGADWIPDHTYQTEVTPARLQERIDQAVAANMDLLRIWGGGTFESDAFYDACDRAGLLVWQDLPFACASYPEDPDTLANVAAEVHDAVVRLGSHPSLAIWNGSNECIWGWFDWDWQEPLAGRPWGLGYYLGLAPRLLAELDPDRPYQPSSPWSGSLDIHPNDDAHGTSHLWDVWNRLDYEAYRSHRPRFVPEFGYQAPPTWATLRDALGADGMRLGSPELLAHQKASGGMAKLQRGLDRRFPGIERLEDWHFLAQVEQARALWVGLTHLRSLHETCSGAVVWQINDCWPSISWAIVDVAGRPKPAWYAVRAAYRDRLAAFAVDPDADRPHVALVNDHAEPWRAQGQLRRVGFGGDVLASAVVDVSVAPRGAAMMVIPGALGTPGDRRRELLVLDVDGTRDTWWFGDDDDLATTPPELDVTVTPTPDGATVEVHARSLARDLCLLADHVAPDVTVDRALVTLLPGESVTFRVTARTPIPAAVLEALGRAPALRAANDFVARVG
ncbi:MAG: glycoside hydrolase family 2 protein [Candidatus Limnocylindrales bacterium]